MTTALLEVVAKKLEQGEAPPTILRSIPPAERRAVVEWGALELAFAVLEGWPPRERIITVLSGTPDPGVAARRMARLLVAIWSDPATPHPTDGGPR